MIMFYFYLEIMDDKIADQLVAGKGLGFYIEAKQWLCI